MARRRTSVTSSSSYKVVVDQECNGDLKWLNWLVIALITREIRYHDDHNSLPAPTIT